MSIARLDLLFKKLEGLEDVALEGAVKGVAKSLMKIQSDAKIHVLSDSGMLKNSIHTSLDVDSNEITGEVYTTNDHAMYVEFGTGPVGEKSKKEIPPGVAIQYKDKGWLVPVEYFPNYKQYGMVAIEIKGALFVPTNGQPAQQFMTPAAKMNKKTASKNVSVEVNRSLKGLGV